MATFNKINQFVEDLAHGVHNLSSDVIKIVLISNSPASLTTYSQIQSAGGELTTGNGYTAGGITLSGTRVSSETGGTYKLDFGTDPQWTASGGNLGGGSFRYVVIYNDTASFKNTIGYWDYGSALTIADGNSFTVQFDGTNGILTIA